MTDDEVPTESARRAAAELEILPEEMVRILSVWSRHAKDVAMERRKVANTRRTVVE